MIIWSSDAPNVAEIVVIDWDEGMKRDEGSIQITDSSLPCFDLDMAELEKGLTELGKGMADYEKGMADYKKSMDEWGEKFGKDIAGSSRSGRWNLSRSSRISRISTLLSRCPN